MIKPKKSLGQNFLIDKNIINKIISSGKIKKENIIEIGPGTGNLSKNLINTDCKSLTLIEKDSHLANEIKKNKIFKKKTNILIQDILKFDLEKKIKTNSIIFGNLPYNISTKILTNLIKFNVWPPKYKRLVLMFQREVADKIMAKSNTEDYGRLAVLTHLRLKIVNHFKISKNCFFPRPKVDSSLLVFEPILNKKFKIKNINSVEYITRILFSNKRKMINKGFNKLFKNYTSIAKEIKIDLSSRPSQLSFDEYYKIAESFEKKFFS